MCDRNHPLDMSSLNSSSAAKSQQWRNDLMMKNVEQTPTYDIPKEMQAKFQNHILASTTVCCDQANCDKAKLESMPEQYFREPALPYGVGGAPLGTPEGNETPAGNPQQKKEPPAPAPESYVQGYCPCAANRGHLVTVCCVRRDCDEATKIGTVRERPRTNNHFKY